MASTDTGTLAIAFARCAVRVTSDPALARRLAACREVDAFDSALRQELSGDADISARELHRSDNRSPHPGIERRSWPVAQRRDRRSSRRMRAALGSLAQRPASTQP
jgi:hypothetical protein